MKKIVILLLLFFVSLSAYADSELILKNKARRFCRSNPEQCTPTYIMEKFPGSSVTRGENGNCVNVEISNIKTNGRERQINQEVIMGDLTVICD